MKLEIEEPGSLTGRDGFTCEWGEGWKMKREIEWQNPVPLVSGLVLERALGGNDSRGVDDGWKDLMGSRGQMR